MKRYSFHMVENSPWPILVSFTVLFTALGGAMYMHFLKQGLTILLCSLGLLIVMMNLWFRDVVREGTYLKEYSEKVMIAIRFGFISVIVSEVVVFLRKNKDKKSMALPILLSSSVNDFDYYNYCYKLSIIITVTMLFLEIILRMWFPELKSKYLDVRLCFFCLLMVIGLLKFIITSGHLTLARRVVSVFAFFLMAPILILKNSVLSLKVKYMFMVIWYSVFGVIVLLYYTLMEPTIKVSEVILWISESITIVVGVITLISFSTLFVLLFFYERLQFNYKEINHNFQIIKAFLLDLLCLWLVYVCSEKKEETGNINLHFSKLIIYYMIGIIIVTILLGPLGVVILFLASGILFFMGQRYESLLLNLKTNEDAKNYRNGFNEGFENCYLIYKKFINNKSKEQLKTELINNIGIVSDTLAFILKRGEQIKSISTNEDDFSANICYFVEPTGFEAGFHYSYGEHQASFDFKGRSFKPSEVKLLAKASYVGAGCASICVLGYIGFKYYEAHVKMQISNNETKMFMSEQETIREKNRQQHAFEMQKSSQQHALETQKSSQQHALETQKNSNWLNKIFGR